ncbi:phosphodiester glycosidase family protein [Chitinispirillales bacterium ANBcel5]|uniref:phosphodiester glycosidase family protein n=1 Tax=Cellulosispirillum alkaliphilum TaxID=3039283 RepID=UPI002A52B25E|nr:phosphodiester glycosidase family protein [Chitinispirillales bacterium ANBcel5]
MKTVIVLLFSATLLYSSQDIQWKKLSEGLEYGKALSSLYLPLDSVYINLLRIDPAHYKLQLFNASHPTQGSAMSARAWANQEGLTAVINAAMYQQDHLSSVSFMQNNDHINNPRLSKDRTVLAFDPLVQGIAPVRIIDMECDDFDSLREQYGSFVQSIRMLSCTGRNVWQENTRRWSIAAVGTDSSENLLFIHVRAPHSVHELINILIELPIDLNRVMYMEGGSQAQLYFESEKRNYQFIGNYSSGGRAFTISPLPNVLGISRISESD